MDMKTLLAPSIDVTSKKLAQVSFRASEDLVNNFNEVCEANQVPAAEVFRRFMNEVVTNTKVKK